VNIVWRIREVSGARREMAISPKMLWPSVAHKIYKAEEWTNINATRNAENFVRSL